MYRKIGPTRGKCEVQKVAYQKDKGSMTRNVVKWSFRFGKI